MKFPKRILLQATLWGVLTSCTVTVPFTAELQQQYQLGSTQIARLQFYLSDPVVLYKLTEQGAARAQSGALVVAHDNHLEEIILRPGTPGVVVGQQQDLLLVSFELGDGKHLVFGNRSGSGKYHLMAEDWERGHGKVHYAHATYFAAPGSGKACLEVQLRKVREQAKSTHIVEGRRVEQH
jgi:hypothetical protein